MTLHVLAGITGHARSEAPLECCGLLAGEGGLIDEYIETRNLRSSGVAYQIDPVDHFAALKRLRARGRAILGAYHSHPRSAAVPSPTDLAEAADGEFIHVIVSLVAEPPDVRAYRLDGGHVAVVSIAPVP